jgi:hypothetical protein
MSDYVAPYGGNCGTCNKTGGSKRRRAKRTVSRRKGKGVKGGFSLTNSFKNLVSKTKNFFTRNKNHTKISGKSKK